MTTASRTIFYSWQAETPNKTNRGFLQDALERAADAVAADLDVAPVIERDTRNVPGSPDIVQTIFGKIEMSDLFVADITLINRDDAPRRTPNPNVLLELGYAMHALTNDRIILVMNTAYGPIEDLPFDLKMRRVIAYTVTTEQEDKAAERKRLVGILRQAIATALTIPQPKRGAVPVATLTALLEHADFNYRVLRLITEISKIPGHAITNNPRPPEYDKGRRALEKEFAHDFHQFERAMAAASAIITQLAAAGGDDVVALLAAIKRVTSTVADLEHWSRNRQDAIDLAWLPQTLRIDAENAATNLQTLAAKHLTT